MQKDQPALPANRAFAVQIHAEADVEYGKFRGRVEHIVSGRATHFASVEELVAFIIRLIRVEAQKNS